MLYGILTMLVYYELLVCNLPPNRSVPDKLWQGDQSKALQIHAIAVIVLFTLLTGWNIHHYASSEITTIELLIFSTIQGFYYLRIKCYSELGRQFTFQLGTWDNQVLVETGPYKYLAHPSYTAQFGHMFMSYLFLRLPWSIFLLLVVSSLIQIPSRIKVEEEMMTAKFGDLYQAYLEARYRLIPLI